MLLRVRGPILWRIAMMSTIELRQTDRLMGEAPKNMIGFDLTEIELGGSDAASTQNHRILVRRIKERLWHRLSTDCQADSDCVLGDPLGPWSWLSKPHERAST